MADDLDSDARPVRRVSRDTRPSREQTDPDEQPT
jgi:hypothetical protein